jgi:hypothetical protein
LLRRLSQARGVSEAEIVRQAIEREVTGVSSLSPPPDRAAWEEIIGFVEARKALAAKGDKPYRRNREDAYTERENRFSEDFRVGSTIDGIRFVNPFSPGFVIKTWIQ